MAITIDWLNRIINVPKADMTLIQSSPTEIRELDINAFRLALKDLEDGEEGMVNPDTHNHNTEVTVGGLALARVVEIINGYTVTFEDGQYAVNLTGANSNVGDVVNVNQVSVRSFNSAGLVSSAAIEYSSFNGGVLVDVNSTTTGTTFPAGTEQAPVNNLADALLIANFRGFNKIFLKSSATITGIDLDGFQIIGADKTNIEVTIDPSADVQNAVIENCRVTGTLDGGSQLVGCNINNLTFVNGTIERCVINGTITLGGGAQANILDCWSGTPGVSAPTIDCGGSGQSLGIRNYVGGIQLTNKSGTEDISIDIASGQVILDSTVTNGTVVVRGTAKLTDNSNGATIDTSGLVFADESQLASFDGAVYLNGTGGASGTKFPLGTRTSPIDNLADAKTVLSNRGLSCIVVVGTVVIGASDDISDITFEGENALKSVMVLTPGCSTARTTFKNMIITGQVDGSIFCEKVGLNNVSNIGSDDEPTVLNECVLMEGTVSMRPSLTTPQNIQIADCVSGVSPSSATTGVVFNFNGCNIPIAFRRYSGNLAVDNMTTDQVLVVEFTTGTLTVMGTCNMGTVYVRGVAEVIDNSDDGCMVDTTGVVKPPDVDQITSKTATLPIVIPAS